MKVKAKSGEGMYGCGIFFFFFFKQKTAYEILA